MFLFVIVLHLLYTFIVRADCDALSIMKQIHFIKHSAGDSQIQL